MDCAISANDNFVITGGTGKTLKVWSINESDMDFSHILGGERSFFLSHLEHNQTVTTICSSNVGSMIISGSEDTYVKIWDLRERRFVKRMWVPFSSLTIRVSHTEKVNRVVICPTNENFFLSLGADKDVKLFPYESHLIRRFDTRTFCCVNTFRGHNYAVTTAAFLPADGRLFTTCDFNGCINYWSL